MFNTMNFGSRKTTRMKTLVLIIFSVLTGIAIAEDGKTTYQTLPNSSVRDYRAPAYVTEGNTTYQTLPNSNIRDFRAPTYVTKGNTTYKTLPGSSLRNYSVPASVSSRGKK